MQLPLLGLTQNSQPLVNAHAEHTTNPQHHIY